MRWFERQRIEWIQLHLQKTGHIRRKDIVEQFQISVPQASKDLQTYLAFYKRWKAPKITYNKTSRRYEVATP